MCFSNLLALALSLRHFTGSDVTFRKDEDIAIDQDCFDTTSSLVGNQSRMHLSVISVLSNLSNASFSTIIIQKLL